MLLVIDNYDSFVHNLSRYLQRLGQATRVVRNDAISADEVSAMNPRAIVLSPGPGAPQSAGNGVSIVPGYRFTLRGERIDALVFPEKGLRQAPLSPVDRRPMPRAGRNRVLALLEEAV